MARCEGDRDGLAVDVAMDVSDRRLLDLEGKVRNLEIGLESQRSIGIAIGLLAQRFDCTTDEAWSLLARLSQDCNVKVREIARILIEAKDGRIPDCAASTLARVVARLPAELTPGTEGTGP